MNKKGFSLVELIGVIAVLALIITLIVPIISKSAESSRQKTYETKMESIKKASIEYAEDNYMNLVESGKNSTNNCKNETLNNIPYVTCEIIIKDLIPTYVIADREGPDATAKGFLEDPRDTTKSLDNQKMQIKINLNTRKITSEISKE